ncbi:hypothetical protein EYB59_21815 [Acinetobacter bereziniae]|uniref:hypothetical protein n=1 Tax=Acinetobacter bereziniae TaxID=106648 RepID=UPI00111B0CE6|nr:hypothetical protein [Acinetobacter bereziniae]TNL43677.1 hypothetical protein EYB59_21815 [Acinetobacter bereziniae]
MSNSIPPMNLDSHGRLIMISPEQSTQNKTAQKNIKTCKNTVESPLKSLENSLVSTPIYNMRVTMRKI